MNMQLQAINGRDELSGPAQEFLYESLELNAPGTCWILVPVNDCIKKFDGMFEKDVEMLKQSKCDWLAI